MSLEHSGQDQSLNRKILGLALPSLGSLVAEPLMVMADSAMIGHLGTPELAGLTLASSVNVFIVGICIFLVYTTTAVSSRQLGSRDRAGALKTGVDGIWLGLLVGVFIAITVYFTAPWLICLFGSNPEVSDFATQYLRYSAGSLVGMMLVLAGTGALRGQLDARTPLVITVAGALLNVSLNAVFIFGLNLSVAGAGLGTTLAASAMGLAFVGRIIHVARNAGVAMNPEFKAVLGALRGGIPLMIRTLTMQIIILATLWVAAYLGEIAVAGRQVAATTWSLTANLLDSLAIATQALVGFELGRADRVKIRSLIIHVTRWGLGLGAALGVLLAAVSVVWPRLFTSDFEVRYAATLALLVSAVFLPLAAVVFVFDGILIGANDAWYLAGAGVVNLGVYLPVLMGVVRMFSSTDEPGLSAGLQATGLMWLWGCYCGVFFLTRLVTLRWRLRGDTWMKLPDIDGESVN